MFVAVDTSVSTDSERPGTLWFCREDVEENELTPSKGSSFVNNGAVSLKGILADSFSPPFDECSLIEYR